MSVMATTPKQVRQGRGIRGLPRRNALLGGTTTTHDITTAIRYLASPRSLVDGAALRSFEKSFATRVGAKHVISFAAGRVGLYAILRSLGIGAGDEVLVPVPTHIVVANAVRYTGAEPLYADCDLSNYNIDLEQAEKRVTPRTRALLVQHTFGIPVDMGNACAVADRNGLYLIEDCVHALGATFNGAQLGTFGRAAFFSTEETKTISTTMGGMVTTDDDEIAGRLYAFQQSCQLPSASQASRCLLKIVIYHALTEPRTHVLARAAYELGGRRHPLPRPTEAAELRGERLADFARRLSNGQAAVGLTQLATLEANLAHRRLIAERYRALLAPHGFRLPEPPPASEPAFVRYPVWVEDRQAVQRAVGARAVLGTWFTSVLEEAVDPRCGGYLSGTCPRAEDAARHLVNLPTHARVNERDAEEIAARVISAQRLSRTSLNTGLLSVPLRNPVRSSQAGSPPRSSMISPDNRCCPLARFVLLPSIPLLRSSAGSSCFVQLPDDTCGQDLQRFEGQPVGNPEPGRRGGPSGTHCAWPATPCPENCGIDLAASISYFQ
jgi:perosamine synthetase